MIELDIIAKTRLFRYHFVQKRFFGAFFGKIAPFSYKMLSNKTIIPFFCRVLRKNRAVCVKTGVTGRRTNAKCAQCAISNRTSAFCAFLFRIMARLIGDRKRTPTFCADSVRPRVFWLFCGVLRQNRHFFARRKRQNILIFLN